jgi:hypothetical protein
MRLLLALAAGLLLASSLAGCFERSGTLVVQAQVSDAGAVREFRSLNLSIDRIKVDARTMNPEVVASLVQRIDMVQASQTGEAFELFRAQVRADRYPRITLQTPPGATFQGTLQDGTQVGVVVPPLVVQPDLEVPRGGSAGYLVALKAQKTFSGQGAPTYSIIVDAEASRPL